MNVLKKSSVKLCCKRAADLCFLVFAYAKSRFSNDAAQVYNLSAGAAYVNI